LFLSFQDSEDTVMRAAWPVYDEGLNSPKAEAEIELLKEAVRGIRNIRTEKQVPPAQKIKIVVQPSSAEVQAVFKQGRAAVSFLAGASEMTVLPAATGTTAPNAGLKPEDGDSGNAVLSGGTDIDNAVSLVLSGAVIYLPLADLVDTEREKGRLDRELKRLSQELARVEGKLNNEGFTAKAPPEVVAAEREKMDKFQTMRRQVEEQLKHLSTV
jgi:valyl-tRNA synthetase